MKCFGVCPRAGKYSASGYRGITLIAEIDGKPLEVQLVTPYMVMWADWAYSVLLDVSISLTCYACVVHVSYNCNACVVH